MKKIYKQLTQEQKARGVIFSSALSKSTVEQEDDTIHEVTNRDRDGSRQITLLKDDKFFNNSPWKNNIIRQ